MSSAPVPTNRTSWLRLALLGAALLAIALAGSRLLRSDVAIAMPMRDFVQYWGAAQLLRRGENPYDLERLGELERQAGRTTEPPLPMLNPPWALPFVLPLAWMSARMAHLVWLGLHLLLLLVCAEWSWRLFSGSAQQRLLAHVLTWTFVPAAFALVLGQISPLLVLGAVGFLGFARARRDGLAGAACCLLAIKPHLVYLFWPALLIWILQHRRWRVLTGGIVAGLLLTGVALAFHPTVCADYWHLLASNPTQQYESPTWGTLLRLSFAARAVSWQFVSLLPGFLWLALWWPRRDRSDPLSWMPLLLLVSVLTAPYGAWLFDLVLLLVPVLQLGAALAARVSWHRAVAALAHVLVNLVVLMQTLRESRYLDFMWLTPVLLLGYVLLRPAGEKDPRGFQRFFLLMI